MGLAGWISHDRRRSPHAAKVYAHGREPALQSIAGRASWLAGQRRREVSTPLAHGTCCDSLNLASIRAEA